MDWPSRSSKPRIFDAQEHHYSILCTLLCYTLSVDRFRSQYEFIGIIMAIGSLDIKQEIIKIAKLQEQLKERRQQEMDLTLKVDKGQSQHRAEMLQMELKHLQTVRDLEERHTQQILGQKRELKALRGYEQSARDAKEENTSVKEKSRELDGNLKKRLQAQGDKSGGTAVGTGMR